MTRHRRRQRGTSLIEILISLAVVMVGMLALFKTLSTSIVGSTTASRLTQAQQRAVLVMENIRVTPKAVLSCLVTTAPGSGWTACENMCFTALPGPLNKSIDSCTFYNLKHTTGALPVLSADQDANKQNYFVVTSNGANAFTEVTLPPSAGITAALYDIKVVIGWNDDNTTTQPPNHFIVLRSGVYQP